MATHASQPSALATTRGKLILALLAAVAFLDFVDASIVNVALPSIRSDLDFSEQALQWVPSAYLLTYGGFMLLGGRAADLLGRRRVLVAGTVVIGLASLVGGLAQSSGLLVAARLAQGLGAAAMLPAALSILTTTFKRARTATTALAVWGAMGGLASAAGVLLGGLLTEGLGWRWVMFVNPLAALLVLGGIFLLISGERHSARLADFDLRGAIIGDRRNAAAGIRARRGTGPGLGAATTMAELSGALVLLAAFVVNELRTRNPLLPMSIFRVKGLAAADTTQLVAFAGLLSMFFFLTLYMQNVLGYSPIQAGAAYLPLTLGVIVSAGAGSQLVPRFGTRPVIAVGALLSSAGVYWLSRIPVDGSYVADLLPGLMIASLGLGAAFVAILSAANAGVDADKSGLAAALLNASQQVGGALGLAIFTAIATSRTSDLIASHMSTPEALTSGFSRALLASSLFLLAASVLALRITNTRGEVQEPASGHGPAATLPQAAGA